MINLTRPLKLGDLPDHAANAWGDREALVFGERRWTFRQMQSEVDILAWTLMSAGVESGEKIGLWFVNRPEYIFLFFAIAKVGAVAVPLNTRYRANDISYCLAQSECAVLLYMEDSGPIDFGSMVRAAVTDREEAGGGTIRSSKFPSLRRLITIGESADRTATALSVLVAASGPIDHAALRRRADGIDEADLAMIVYTSGTTGFAKGVMLAHRGIRQCVVRSLIWGSNFMDRQLHYLPMFHLYAIGFVTVPSVALGSCQILTETFDGEEAVRLIEQERATIIHGFDPHYRDILAAQERIRCDLSSLRIGSFPSGPENCIPVVVAANEALCPIYPSFGMTETWSGITAGYLDCSVEQRSESSGFPLPDIEVRVVDPETGAQQPAGVQGEILIRSPYQMLGYYRMEEETAKTIDSNGFLHTGDAGYLREDGYLRFTGRFKDMLKVGGENVSPAEVELLLSEIPGVSEVAVVGYPDLRLQEVAVAYIVPRDRASKLTLDDVVAHCHGKIASFKIPKQIFLVDELPMTPSGKVQKAKLRELASQHFAQTRSG